MKPFHILERTLAFFMFGVASTASDTQRCYYDVDQLAPDYIIPCYSRYTSTIFSCCKVGSMCLENGACYDGGTGDTYQYGCTDENYQHANCPKKCNLSRADTNWVGLVYCNGEGNLPNNTWLCHHPSNCGSNGCDSNWDPELQTLPPVSCGDLDDSYKAFDAESILLDVTSLPGPTGLSSYFSDHPVATATTSSTTSNPTATSVTSDRSYLVSSATTSSTQSATTSSTEPSSANEHSSTSHTVPMAVGLGVGIPIILALAGFLLYYFRKRRNQPREISETDTKSRGDTDFGGAVYAHKAELPGESRPLSEMPGSPVTIVDKMDGSIVGGRSPEPNHSPFVSPIQSEFSGKSREHRMSNMYGNQLHELPE